MSARRKHGKLVKKPRHTKRAPRRGGLIVARTLNDATRGAANHEVRYYRGPGGSVVVWIDGRFTVKPSGFKTNGLARMPDNLARRVNDALERGDTHG